jgi:hypothetical protein
MSKERDLLPWVLGALSATAVAVAITAVSSTKTAPPAPTPMVAAQSAVPVQSPAAAPAAVDAASAPTPQADPTPQQSPLQAQAAPEPPASSGQIWECTTKGVKTFSNNPCGEKSTLLEVGPINTMNPTPAVHYARAYAPEPRYAPAYVDSGSSADQEPYSDSVSAESGGNSYTIVQGVGFIARRRPEHPHHRPMPNHHNSGPMPRRY